jgi:hypothetical protein
VDRRLLLLNALEQQMQFSTASDPLAEGHPTAQPHVVP